MMKKSFTQIFWCMLILAPALLLFTAVTDLPHVLVIVTFGYILSLMRPKPLVWTDRTIIYTLVVIAVTVVLLDLVFPFNQDRFGYITMVIQPQFYTVGAFYLAVALTFFNTGRAMVGGTAAVALFSLIASADVFNLNVANARIPLIDTFINQHFYNIYVWVMFIELGIVLAAFRHSAPAVRVSARTLTTRRIVLGILWIILPLSIYGSFRVYRHFEGELRRWENMLIRMGSRQGWMQRGKTVVFDKETNLYRVMSPEVLANQQQIIMRVIADSAPGYMRGRVYDEYADGVWKEAAEKETPAAVVEKAYEGMLTFKSFFITPERSQYFYQCQVYQDGKFISDVLLVPGTIEKLDAIATRASISESGIIKLDEWQKDGGYTVFASGGVNEAYPKPVTKLPSYYRQVPPGIRPALREILASISGLKAARADAERFRLLLEWYHRNFQYSLSWEGDPGADPVVHFLKNVRKGHCELYAASMALLLREQGIPARYVTGFICEEPHPSGKYYVARLGNAHAWLEAFDRQNQRWILLEPTPASEIGGPRGEWNTFSDWRDRINQGWQQLLASLRRGLFADAILNALDFIWTILRSTLVNPVGIPLLAALGIWYWRRRRRKRRFGAGRELPREIIALGKLYRKRVAAWEKKLALPPEPGRTSSELLELLRRSGRLTPEELIQAEEFIYRYQRLRFSARPVSREELKALAGIGK